jgi:hypothetical protein
MLSLQDTLITDSDMSSRKHAGVPARKVEAAHPEERITYKGLPVGEQLGEKVEEELAGAVVDIQGMIDEVLQGKPFELQDLGDAFKSGSELLQQLKPVPLSGMHVQLESGRSEPAHMEMPFMFDESAFGMTIPGALSEQGNYSPNQDGIFMAHDAAKASFTAGIVHNDAATPESAAATNLETVSAAYDVSKIREPALSEMVFRMNNRIAPLEAELGNSFPHVSMLRLKPTDVAREYTLEVANNGFFRTLVINKDDQDVRTTAPVDTREDNEYLATLYDRPAKEVLDTMIEATPSSADRDLLVKMRTDLESEKLDQDRIRRVLRNFLLEPITEKFQVQTGDVVVMVPESAVEEFGGSEIFAQYFSTLIREGQSLQNVCRALMAALEKTMNSGVSSDEGTVNFDDIIQEVSGEAPRQHEKTPQKKELMDQSMSIIAFEVPETL